MVAQICGMLISVINRCQAWLAMIFHSTGTLGIYMAMICVWLIIHYVASPLVYAGTSDLASHNLQAAKKGAKNAYRNHVTNRTPTTSRLRRISSREQRRR